MHVFHDSAKKEERKKKKKEKKPFVMKSSFAHYTFMPCVKFKATQLWASESESCISAVGSAESSSDSVWFLHTWTRSV